MSASARILITSWVHPEVRELLAPYGRLVINEDRERRWNPAEVAARAAEADAIMTFMTDRVDGTLLDACPRLRVIACALKGFDNFDVAACTRRGVWLTIVPDLLTTPTAELAVALTLGLARRVRCGDARVRSPAFDGWRPVLYGRGLAGATVGIVGFGAVGRAVAWRLRGFGCRMLAWDSRPPTLADQAEFGVDSATFEQLIERADVVISTLPLTPALRHMFGPRTLRRFRPDALLVNVGRGSVVDEAAVADALARGRLGGYAADVFEMEDWALPDRPRQIPPELLAMTDRTLFTPHLGSAVDEVRCDIALAAARNIIAVLEGRNPPDAVNGPFQRGAGRRSAVSA